MRAVSGIPGTRPAGTRAAALRACLAGLRAAALRACLAGLRAVALRACLAGLCAVALQSAPAGGPLGPAPVRAGTTLEGEYNLMLDVRKQDRLYPWNFDSNNQDTESRADMWLFSQPRVGVEAYLKFGARWHPSDNSSERPVFQYREAHLRYRLQLGSRPADIYLFSRQNRFWVDNHLIKVVDFDPPSNGGNAQGVRIDSLRFFDGFNATVIASDFSGEFDPTGNRKDASKTDDAYIIRARQELLDKKLRLGFTANRKVENEPGEGTNSHADVLGADLRFTWRNMDFSLEYAASSTAGPGPVAPDSVRDYTVDESGAHHPYAEPVLRRKFLGIPLSDRGVWVGEIRSLKLGNPTLGYLNVAPIGWLRGPLFDNRLGDSNRDERGFLINTWYLMPARAITFTNNFLKYEKRASLRRKVKEWYSEAYIEFVNGFTGKVFYRRHRTVDQLGGGLEREDRNDDIYAELQVESRLAWLRIEGKIKNLSTEFEKQLASIETSVNVGAKTKVYSRLMFGNDPTGLRRILFTQLQYRPAGNMDLFVEYGPGWIGGGSRPVDDGNLEGNGFQRDLIKVYFKGKF
ncbi:MAG: hypothetical protein HZB25_01705 [Candidatus Eisenbacteria bacterium]|nr:hypothetical protein [Candidatus Eisenbacteria bacterium]